MKKVVFVVFCFLSFFSFVDAEEKIEVSLVKCVDGDTAVFNINDDDKKFRFLAIDTPETVHPIKGEENGGKLASEYTCDLLTITKKIEILYDEKGSHTDKYGRELAWVYIDDVLLQEKLIGEGYAEVAYIYYKYNFVEKLCNVQQSAIKNKLGIWADGVREEGYCKSKNNNTTSAISKTTTKSKKKSVSKNQEKIIEYIIDEKYDKALKLMIKDTTSIYILIILIILLIIVKLLKKKK